MLCVIDCSTRRAQFPWKHSFHVAQYRIQLVLSISLRFFFALFDYFLIYLIWNRSRILNQSQQLLFFSTYIFHFWYDRLRHNFHTFYSSRIPNSVQLHLKAPACVFFYWNKCQYQTNKCYAILSSYYRNDLFCHRKLIEAFLSLNYKFTFFPLSIFLHRPSTKNVSNVASAQNV